MPTSCSISESLSDTCISTYRYAFNGKLHDDNIYGKDNSYDYGMRTYDPRLGRFMSVDPIAKQFPELSTYQFASNSPIQAIDLDGKEEWFRTDYKDVNGALYKTEIRMVSNNDLGQSIQTVYFTTVQQNADGTFTKTYDGVLQGTINGNNAFGSDKQANYIRQAALHLDKNNQPVKFSGGPMKTVPKGGGQTNTFFLTPNGIGGPVGFQATYIAPNGMHWIDTKDKNNYEPGFDVITITGATPTIGNLYNGTTPANDLNFINAVPKTGAERIGLNNSLTDPGTSTQGVGGPNYNGLPASGGSGTTTTPAQNGSQKFPPPPSSSNNQ